MAFPYVFESTFYTGDASEWDNSIDPFNFLDFPHYTELSLYPSSAVPYTGAYCMRNRMGQSTAYRYVLKDLAIANGETRWLTFNILFSEDFSGTGDSLFHILEVVSNKSPNTSEGVVGVQYTASSDSFVMGLGELVPTSFGAVIERGVWHTVEFTITLDTGGSGTIDMYVTKDGDPPATSVYASQVSGLTHAAVLSVFLGCRDLELTMKFGYILFDHFVMDDERVYPRQRFPLSKVLSASGHAFVGPGRVRAVRLLSGSTDNVVSVYDTDQSVGTDPTRAKCELKGIVANASYTWDTPFTVTRGAFVEISGTSTRAHVDYEPLAMDDSALVHLGRSRSTV